MGSIGDIFWAFRGDGTKLQADAKSEGAKAGNTLGSSMVANIKKSWTGANIGQGLTQGLGIAGAFGAVNLVSGAISGFISLLGDATQAALKDEESQNRLRASLQANVPNWDGNTSAIEASITAAQRLGFEDETLRDSLTVLVGATHDVSKAQSIMSTAMDLARFKGVDLRTASEALIKVEGGHYKALAQLGIKLEEGATQTEALAAVQKVAAGQAEAFANTNSGKLLASQIALDEAMENFGYKVMPLVIDGMVGGAKAATDFVTALDLLTGKAGATTDAQLDQVDAASQLIDVLSLFNPMGKELDRQLRDEIAKRRDAIKVYDEQAAAVHDFRLKEQDDLAASSRNVLGIAAAWDTTAADMETKRGTMVFALEKVGKSFTRTADLADTANSRMRESWKKTADFITDRANDLISDAFAPIDAYDSLLADNAEANAQRKILATKAVTDEQKAAAREAKAALDSTMQDTARQLVVLAGAGYVNSNEYKKGLASLQTYAAGLKDQSKADVNAAIAEIHRLESVAAAAHPTVTMHVKVPKVTYSFDSGPHVTTGSGRLDDWRIFDRGGRPDPFVPALIGRGPYQEMFIPDRPGTIVPHDQTERMLGGNTYNFTVALPTTARPDPFETADQLRRLARFGVFDK